MILVYTGDGKGKTSACVGQAVRAMGQNLFVAFGQFMKRDGQAGEQAMLAKLLGEHFLPVGWAFCVPMQSAPRTVRPPFGCSVGRASSLSRQTCWCWTKPCMP